MPKLLQINVCLNFSTGKIAQAIGDAAIAAGWESWIAYSGRSQTISSKSKLIKVGSFLDACEHFAENRLFDREGLASRCETKRLVERIKEIQPDVVHLHNIHDHWLNYRILFEYLNTTDIEVVWTFHDCWAFTGHCYHFVEANCDRWRTGCHDCPLKNKWGLDRSHRNYALKKSLFAANRYLTIVSCSDWMGGFVKESFLKYCGQKVIHNGVDLNVYKPAELERSGKFRIIAVSNVWLPYKGINDLYRLRKALSDEYELVIVGLTAQQMQTLPKGIIGIQKTQNVQQLVDLYSSADMLINPTYADTFPTVNLEALACGTPVVTYRTGGSPEAVDENTGIVVEQGDFKRLCAAIEVVRKNGKAHYSAACRKRAEENFDKGKCFEKYIDLYRSLLKNKRV